VEYIRRENELKEGIEPKEAREGPIGLGFRVPMIIASPWSRGGQVCSQVYDHTSVLQFLEIFLKKKFGRDVKETNISDWRRTITGDLTAAFRTYDDKHPASVSFLEKDPFIEKIYNAKFKKEPADFRPLSVREIEEINQSSSSSPLMAQQERGLRPSSALPYQLYAEGKLSDDKKNFELTLTAGNEIFGKQSAGSPFNVYLPEKYAVREGGFDHVGSRSYAVVAGDRLSDSWIVQSFEKGIYHLQVYGPNGFFREFKGNTDDPDVAVLCEYERTAGLTKKPSGNLAMQIKNLSSASHYTVEIRDNAYKNKPVIKLLKAGKSAQRQGDRIVLDLGESYGWYDFTLRVQGFDHFEKRYAGRVETGKESFSDPAMG
jgi:phospholipase C